MIDYKKYLSIPYKPLGRDWSGCDCWGLLCMIAKSEWNVTLPDERLHKVLPEEKLDEIETLMSSYKLTNKPVACGIGLCFTRNLHAVLFLSSTLCIEMLAEGVFVSKVSKYTNEYLRFYELKG